MQSRYTCGGSIAGNPFDQKDKDGNSCTNDATDDENSLPRELCLTKLVPSLAERFQNSATVACGRPMYEVQGWGSGLNGTLTNAEATIQRGYILYAMGFGFLFLAIAGNLIFGAQVCEEEGVF